ncbi:MAG: response regulator transcription factor [Ignavibacteriaceae bacterium]|nr:response regulator transcription factor [Ignavibacteriaceae bacterium]
MIKILLADDHTDIVEFLKYNLEKNHFTVITAFNGNEALEKLSENPDLIILDIMMPELDGFETLKKIREDKNFDRIPILLLTAKEGELNEIKGLELGANDYIKKPISPYKLIARIKSNLRSTKISETKQAPLLNVKYGPIEINKETYEVFIDGDQKIFPRKEFEILYLFLTNPGKVFSREMILNEIWGVEVNIIDRTVDVHIRKIRKKLGEYKDYIDTLKGIGYRLKNLI